MMAGEVAEGRLTDNVTISLLVAVILTVALALVVARLVGRCVLSVGGVSARRRHTLLLLGLCGSGKTALFAQLVARKRVSTRTSIQPNRGIMRPRAATGTMKNNSISIGSQNHEGMPSSSSAAPSMFSGASDASVVVVDFPGHRRLRESLAPALEEAKNVILVVDTVTIQDDRHEGAQALAEFILSVFTSPAFYGVQRVLVACTKRDELTSYSAKAVRRLLEAEITRCITSRRGDLQSFDSILNSDGVAVGNKKSKVGGSSSSRSGRTYQISLGESGKFTFDDFPIPLRFADVSSLVDPAEHPFNVDAVWDFVEGRT